MPVSTSTTAPTKDDLERVGKLLALGRSGDTEEARTAAIKAVQLMKDYQLVLVPQAEIDRIKTVVGEATALAAKSESESTQKMVLSALAGFLLAKKGIGL